jgi:hypothetical protein
LRGAAAASLIPKAAAPAAAAGLQPVVVLPQSDFFSCCRIRLRTFCGSFGSRLGANLANRSGG